MRKIMILAAAALIIPAVSQAKTLEELLVEKGVITKGEASSSGGSSAAKVYWNKGTRFDFPDSGFTAGFATLLQERYTYTDNDNDAGAKDTSSFEVKKARIIVSGSAMHNEFEYYLQSDFADGDDKSTALKDAYVSWHACDWTSLKVGQYKVMHSRQFNNSDWKTQFPDRSNASDYFDLGRQQGLSASMSSEDKMWVLNAGVFNGRSDGEGENSVGVDTSHTGVVSVRVNPTGEMDAYAEGDVDYTEEMATSFGASYAFSDAKNDAGGDAGLEGTELHSISVDGNMKYQGWGIHGELFWESYEPDSASDSVEPLGFYVQGGYFLNPKKFELAARYGYTDCDDGLAGGDCSGNDNVNEVTAGLNYYWWKHHLKASFAYSLLNEDSAGADGDDINTNRWLFQLSSYF